MLETLDQKQVLPSILTFLLFFYQLLLFQIHHLIRHLDYHLNQKNLIFI